MKFWNIEIGAVMKNRVVKLKVIEIDDKESINTALSLVVHVFRKKNLH